MFKLSNKRMIYPVDLRNLKIGNKKEVVNSRTKSDKSSGHDENK